MAIYHLSMQIISRSKGQSAVASASYRSGERLEDERTGETKFYKREVQPETMILAPLNSPKWVQDRESLWNTVEKNEKRKDAQLAREINIALPRELSNSLQKELIQNYVQNEFVNKGMVADIAIHRDDKENPHAHVMLTTREITADGFGPKNRDWNNKELLNHWREEWSNHANKALEKEGIQERISHLSHEARGLEQLPTVHLGHVAHEMEKRGVESDRGSINRDRQEYNRLVVDLQKYREEKQALEQKQAHQQAEKQKLERFSTAAERVDLQEASKLLKAEPSLQNIAKRREQLDKWEVQIDKSGQYLRWKDNKIEEASEHHRWIKYSKDKIKDAQKQIKNINWLNPLKIKENRMTKERAEQNISKAKDDIKFHDKKLNYHREKLEFSNKQEFNQVKIQYQADRPGLMEKNKNARQQIIQERDILKKAETARQNVYVRQVASMYPDRPEMAYMSFSTAQNLNQLNTKNQKIVPIQAIEKLVTSKKEEIKRLEGKISPIKQNRSRLQRAEKRLKNYEKHNIIVKKYENNPFLKGKMLISKSAKQEYDSAVIARKSYQGLMKEEGITGRVDFKKQMDTLSKMEAKIPEFKNQIQSQEKGLGLFDSIVRGIEQAGREMQMEQNRQQQKINSKSKTKNRQRTSGFDR
ncbi:MobQ family relaxase [Peribacillus loiseleuriae]|uniref:MobQ family relaxase n=1 Tax=Peribacillus loiseleuriae TaxID=1679170 RepID=UPI003CFCC5F4